MFPGLLMQKCSAYKVRRARTLPAPFAPCQESQDRASTGQPCLGWGADLRTQAGTEKQESVQKEVLISSGF